MKMRVVVRSSAFVIAVFAAVAAAPSFAAPKLTAIATQESRRPDRFTAIPIWEPMWFARLTATPDGSPLARLEYRGGVQRGVLRPVSGGWDIRERHGEGLAGRVRITCDRLADYDEPVEMKFRVVDGAGDASDWVSLRFPPPLDDEVSEEPTPANVNSERKRLGSVSYLAADDASMSAVRAELERLARLQGGDGIGEVRMEGSPGGRARFVADVLGPPPTPKAVAAPTRPTRDRDRVIGEIKLRTQNW